MSCKVLKYVFFSRHADVFLCLTNKCVPNTQAQLRMEYLLNSTLLAAQGDLLVASFNEDSPAEFLSSKFWDEEIKNAKGMNTEEANIFHMLQTKYGLLVIWTGPMELSHQYDVLN